MQVCANYSCNVSTNPIVSLYPLKKISFGELSDFDKYESAKRKRDDILYSDYKNISKAILNKKISLEEYWQNKNNLAQFIEKKIEDTDHAWKPKEETIENITTEKLKEILKNNHNRVLIDLNGDFYIGNDFTTYKTNLKLNFDNKISDKPIKPQLYPYAIKI